jgi:hypothetical protein
MLEFLEPRASGRKWRLFLCACCRHVWPRLTDERGREAVEVAERYADGRATADELRGVGVRVFRALRSMQSENTPEGNALRAAFGTVYRGRRYAFDAAVYAVGDVAGTDEGESAAQCELLRDIFGNPFQPVTVDPAWLTPTVTSLALSAYEQRELPSGHLDAGRLAVLADALEDAGCDNAELLGHLRGPGPHVRGCWALDLILGRS